MLRIICLVKGVIATKTLRDGSEKKWLKINTCDNYALEVALRYKEQNEDVYIEVVTMGASGCKELLEDSIRKGADYATLITDRKFAGSDTYATSLILKTYIEKTGFDLLLTGNQTSDGDTGQVGIQISEWLGINQLSYVERLTIKPESVNCTIDIDSTKLKINLTYPVLISCQKSVVNRARFIRSDKKHLDVSDKLKIINNEYLHVDETKIGLRHSPTQVVGVEQVSTKPVKRNCPTKTIGMDQVIYEIKEWRK